MFTKFCKQMLKGEKGITGLETAIILIAFVVVAAVFAYTVLSGGLFASQKAGETVYTGLASTADTLQIRGNVTAFRGSGAEIGSTVGRIEITVNTVFSEGGSIDLTPPYIFDGTTLIPTGYQSPIVISYSDEFVTVPDCAWTVNFIGKNDGNYILQDHEQAVISVWLHHYDTEGDPEWTYGGARFLGTHMLDVNQSFNLEIKTPQGAVLPVQRTTPGYIAPVTDLK